MSREGDFACSALVDSFRTARMIFRFAFFVALAFALASCQAQTSSLGRAETPSSKATVAPEKSWTERPGGLIPMTQLKHDIVQKARQNGGNAVIFVSSGSQLAGYYTASSASAYGYGNSAPRVRATIRRVN